METKARKVRLVETERGREKGRRGKEVKITEEWEIWDEKEEAAKSKEEAKKLVSQRFHKWIHVFGKKASERMLKKSCRTMQ